jgi:hypothetical protein
LRSRIPRRATGAWIALRLTCGLRSEGMTQHVRSNYRIHRKATWAVVLFVAVVGALAATVLPAVGAPGDNTGLRSDPLQVQPVEDPSGGSTYTCPAGFNQFQINNPKSGTYSTTVNGLPVSFTIAVSGGGNATKDKYLSFRSSNAVVKVVAIKGGTKNALYSYTAFSSPVTADGYGSGTTNPLTVDTDPADGIGLHAPVDSSGSPYSVSYTTFCFTLPTVPFSCSEDAPMSGIAFAGSGGTVEYRAVLVAKASNECKTGDAVMYSQTSAGNNFNATLYPLTPDPTKKFEVVENIKWTGITGNAQNPVTLQYDDIAPYNGVDTPGIAGNDGLRTMLMCGSDPRLDPIGDPFDLGGTHPTMPDAAAGESPHTTCMLRSTDIAGGIFDAWLYSTVDGYRTGH